VTNKDPFAAMSALLAGLFSRNNTLALVFFLVSYFFGWYGLILLTHSENGLPWPSQPEWIGLGFAFGMGVLLWARNYFVVGDTPTLPTETEREVMRRRTSKVTRAKKKQRRRSR
jgi:hypothetical protein